MQQEIKTQQKEEYKKTELGLLPESWDVVKLKVIGKIITGNTPPKKNKEYWQNGEIDFIKPPDLRNRLIKTFSERISKNAEKRARIVGKDSILISCIGIIGRVGYSAKKIAFNQQINAIEAYENIDNLFLFYVLQNEQQQIENLASFTTVPIVSKAKFSEVQIPFPYLPEQKKIAYVLSAIQTAKEKTEAVVNSLKELKKSMMKHLFTYGVVSLKDAKNVKLKETEIGAVPEDWEVKDIDELYYVKQGKQISAKESKEGKIKKPFLRTSNLTWGKIEISKVDSMYFTKDEFEKLKLKKGDILTCEGGDIGRTAIYNHELEDCAYQNHLHRLRPKTEDTNNLFFVYWMIQKEENKKQALEDLFKSMLYNLMSAKIRVNDMVIKNV